MSLLKGLSARARSLLSSRASEARMEEEFRFHIAMETNRLVAEGLSPEEAHRRALVTALQLRDPRAHERAKLGRIGKLAAGRRGL